MAETNEKRCYTVQEVMDILCVSRPTVYALLKRHEFSWIKIAGSKYRISKRSFDAWLDDHTRSMDDII